MIDAHVQQPGLTAMSIGGDGFLQRSQLYRSRAMTGNECSRTHEEHPYDAVIPISQSLSTSS